MLKKDSGTTPSAKLPLMILLINTSTVVENSFFLKIDMVLDLWKILFVCLFVFSFGAPKNLQKH